MKDCIDVSITDDLELEMVESFNISLEKSPGLSNKFVLAPGHKEVIIIDNDGTYVSLQLLQHCSVTVCSCAQNTWSLVKSFWYCSCVTLAE